MKQIRKQRTIADKTTEELGVFALAGADSAAALETAIQAFDQGLGRALLTGQAETIREALRKLGRDPKTFEIIAAENEEAAAKAAVLAVRAGRADVIMKGQVHTDTLLRAVLDKQEGLRTGRRLSHAFYLTFPDQMGAAAHRPLTITDAAINVAPDVTTRLEILSNAISIHHALGQPRPKAAILSATELANPAMPSSLEAVELVKQAAHLQDKALIAGPLALDLALSKEAAARKGYDHPIAGLADILLVPNIETGNALFKALVHFTRATPAGLVLGARAPIALASRADAPAARLASLALARSVADYERSAR